MEDSYMEKGNVLVIGNSGVGKSTLINAVLGEEQAKTGWGTTGTTQELVIHTSEKVPFRLIDSVGFEPSFIKAQRAIGAVKKWSKNSAKLGKDDTKINLIWFCIEGTSRKLFPKAIRDLSKATSMWESVPVIVVITKSYSLPERSQNIEMVNNAFAKQKRYAKNLRKVIPVVASTYILNDTAFAPPEGIIELIDATNALMPEGIRAGDEDLKAFKLNRKKALAHSVTAAATSSAVVVAAIPLPYPDATLLVPIEIAMLNTLSHIYGISKTESSKAFIDSIIEVGSVSLVAKALLNTLKSIPGINIGASILNAIVAGSIVSLLGETSVYMFEQIYLGKKSVNDIRWAKELLEARFTSSLLDQVKNISERSTNIVDPKEIAKLIMDFIKNSMSDSNKS